MLKTRIIRPLLMVAIVTAFTLFSCGGENSSIEKISESISPFTVTNVLKKIPADASLVAILDMGQIMKKMDYEGFTKTKVFKDVLSELEDDDANDDLRTILKNPSKSGISTKGKACMFVNVLGKDDIIVNLLLPVSNIKDLEAFFKKSAEKNEDSPFNEIKEGDGFKYTEHRDEENQLSLGWTKKMVCMSVSPTQNTTNALKDIFNTKRKESILTNKKFRADKSEGHDFMVWSNSTPIVEALMKDDDFSKQLKGQLFFTGLTEEALNDNVMALYYDFKKGKMQAGLSYHMNKDIEQAYGMIFKNKVKTDFRKFFPKENMVNITTLGLDTKGILELIENRSLTGLVNQQLAEQGITIEELLNGLSGEIAFGNYFDPNEKDILDANKAVIAIAFEKVDLIDKFIEISGKIGSQFERNGNRLTAINNEALKDGGGIIYGKTLVLSADKAILDKIEDGGYKGNEILDKATYKMMTAGWMGSHVDFTSFLKTAKKLAGTSFASDFDEMIVKMLDFYENFETSTATANTTETKLVATLKNKKDNSLKVIVDVFKKLYKKQEENAM